MSETRFWSLLDQARGGADPTGRSASPAHLRSVLTRLSTEDVESFDLRYGRELGALDRWSIWDAGFAVADGMSDDGFEYFRSWLIGKGEVVTRQASTDPDGLVRYLAAADASKDDFDNEDLEYVADDVLEHRLGDDRADDFDDRAMLPGEDDPSGRHLPESAIDAHYPQLAAWAEAHTAAQ
ncbi:DUF4240 domain-containing protein [Curtobacterium sp. VKM Ac-2922]|uniref:DUF4240 domain-containing protein n=1 Tax=Curtobacterium sp. VKM Ac-2922 TaxID=2929475 RepID=UPI001FB444DD|nr:DUF4240 domain-containing protein [Curtobacterium sp. VKM Ac-2922]MCJ1715170.1 DUF4240 domain-containing protein [Curtobacterium sp. VKM Ac-2922]